jgi:N-acetylneuraminic acid mutarotase
MPTRPAPLFMVALLLGTFAQACADPSRPPVLEDLPIGTWTARMPMPIPRQEMPAVAITGRIYVPGGLAAGLRIANEMEVYIPATNSWESAPPLPVPLHHHAGVALGGKLYVIGGYTTIIGAWQASAQVHVFDPNTSLWTTAASMPEGRGAMAAVVHGGRIYVFGGSTGQQTIASALVYDPGANAWTPLPAMPGGVREHMHAAAWADRVYVVGGRPSNSGPVANLTRVESFAPATGQWVVAPSLLLGRSGHAVEVLGAVAYALGGESPEGLIPSVEGFDLAKAQWRYYAPLPGTGRTAMATAVVENTIYAFGGAGSGPQAGPTFAFRVQ